MVVENILESGIKYEGVNINLAGVYLANTLNKERQVKEGLSRLLPFRKAKGKCRRKLTPFQGTFWI